MSSLFEDKILLTKEYKRLFFYYLNDLEQLKCCLCGRYDKKIISDSTLKKLFSNNHKYIFDFIGKQNETRIRYFFGNYDDIDFRDNQIRLIDRLVLDSIHFEIMLVLFIRLNKEYPAFQTEIDKAWHSEIHKHPHLGLMESIHLIQNALKSYKKIIYEDLDFSTQKNISLFTFDQTKVIPDNVVFSHWLPKPVPKTNNSLYIIAFITLFFVFVAAVLLIPLFMASNFSGFGAVTNGGFNVFTGAIIALLTSITGIHIFTSGEHKNKSSKCNEQNVHEGYSSSYVLMHSKIPFTNEPVSPSLVELFTKKQTTSQTQCEDSSEVLWNTMSM